MNDVQEDSEGLEILIFGIDLVMTPLGYDPFEPGPRESRLEYGRGYRSFGWRDETQNVMGSAGESWFSPGAAASSQIANSAFVLFRVTITSPLESIMWSHDSMGGKLNDNAVIGSVSRLVILRSQSRY
jgi:hypothetical protein